MANYEAPLETQEEIRTILPEINNSEKLKLSDVASRELTEKIVGKMEAVGMNERYHQGASVFFRPEILNLGENASLEQILVRAKELNLQVEVYSGGINWRGGKYIHPTELLESEERLMQRITRFSQELSSDLSHEITIPGVKKEEEEASALNFFAEADRAVVITIDPIYREKEVVASSLRSDAIAKQTALETIKSAGVKAEMVNWSDGGFKDIQIQFAGFIAIVQDLHFGIENGLITYQDYENLERKLSEDDNVDARNGFSGLLLRIRRVRGNIQSLDYTPNEKANIKQHLRTPVFLSGYEALRYFESLEDVDNIRGGSPSIPQELAFPFKSTHKIPLIRGPLRNLSNEFLELFAKRESNQILEGILYNVMPKNKIDQQGNLLVVFRLLELGRGIKSSEQINPNELVCKMTQHAIRGIKGIGRDITLGDTSGSVVNSASETNGTPFLSRLINGYKSLYIETRDTDDGIEQPSIHIEIKRALTEIEKLAAAAKLGLITEEVEESPNRLRYVPVTLVETGKHPNGSSLHEARKFDAERWKELSANQDKLTDEERHLLKLASSFFEES